MALDGEDWCDVRPWRLIMTHDGIAKEEDVSILRTAIIICC